MPIEAYSVDSNDWQSYDGAAVIFSIAITKSGENNPNESPPWGPN
jgi:hypothetical protein